MEHIRNFVHLSIIILKDVTFVLNKKILGSYFRNFKNKKNLDKQSLDKYKSLLLLKVNVIYLIFNNEKLNL